MTKKLPERPSHVSFSPDGGVLCIGFESGALWLLDPLSLLPVAESTQFKCVDKLLVLR